MLTKHRWTFYVKLDVLCKVERTDFYIRPVALGKQINNYGEL